MRENRVSVSKKRNLVSMRHMVAMVRMKVKM